MDRALACLYKDHPHEVSAVARYVLGIVMLLVTLLSILLNVMIAIVICRTSLIDKPIRPHITGMLIGSLIYLSSNCFTLLPTVLGSLHIIDPYNAVLTTPNTLGFLLLMFTTTTMAIDRFFIFFMTSIDLMSRIAFRWVIFMGVPYGLAFILTAHMNIIGCYKRVSPYTLGFTYGCSECGGYTLALRVMAFSFSGVNIVIYLALFIKILHMNSIMAQGARLPVAPVKKRELILFATTVILFWVGQRHDNNCVKVVQFSIVCAAQFLGSASFYFLPPLTNYSDISFYLSTIFSSLNTMTNPCVVIAFHRNVRRVVWTYILTAGRSRTAVITLSSKFHHHNAHSHFK